jgi:CubicO group peptidase (beta-lactamase class C family)
VPEEDDVVQHLLATLALGLVATLPTSAPDASIEDVIDREMTASGVPGVAYAVVADGAIASAGARGVVRTGSDVDVTPDRPFLSGPISKSFAAMAVMQLVEAGEVDVGAEISQYLDAFSGRQAGAITVRQLLSHTSGFSTLQGNSSHTGATTGGDELARRVDCIAERAPAYPPGERWEYSNTNYLVLGRRVEVVSGQDYQAYVATTILEPIGMTSSFVSDGESPESMATGHTPWFWTKRPLADGATCRGMAPAGGVVASAHDLALYLQTMMNGKDDVLSAESKAQTMRPAGGAATFYGLGWFVDSGSGIGVGERARACPRRRSSPAWCSCRSSTCSARSGRGPIAQRSAPRRALGSPDCSACGSRCSPRSSQGGTCWSWCRPCSGRRWPRSACSGPTWAWCW